MHEAEPTGMKVLFHYAAGPRLRQRVAEFAREGLNIVCCPEGPDEPFMSELREAEVIWHILKPITPQTIAAAPRLRLIQKIGVGVNTIDLDACRARGIAVCNMPGTNSRAVAEMSLMLMLAALRRLPALQRSCRSGAWTPGQGTSEALGEIGGRTVGLVGFGEIPRMLAPMLRGMGARVLYWSRTAKQVNGAEQRALDDLLGESDIVSLHLPLTPDTTHLLDARRLALMKSGAVLINTARGGLIDEAALIGALQSGAIGAAGLDVFALEPVLAENPLLTMENVVTTPHVAWLTGETWERSFDVAVGNCLALREGRDLLHRVV